MFIWEECELVLLEDFLMVFDNSFESSMGNNFFSI